MVRTKNPLLTLNRIFVDHLRFLESLHLVQTTPVVLFGFERLDALFQLELLAPSHDVEVDLSGLGVALLRVEGVRSLKI